MREERYSIEVSDDFVEIHGDLSIEEAFDYMNFFDKKGYKSLRTGWENSTLLLARKDIAQKQEEIRQEAAKQSEAMYEQFYQSERKEHDKTKERVRQLEDLMKQLMSEEYQKYKALKEENDKLVKNQTVQFLHEDPQVQRILKEGGFIGCTPDKTEIDVSFLHRDPMEIPIPEEGV